MIQEQRKKEHPLKWTQIGNLSPLFQTRQPPPPNSTPKCQLMGCVQCKEQSSIIQIIKGNDIWGRLENSSQNP